MAGEVIGGVAVDRIRAGPATAVEVEVVSPEAGMQIVQVIVDPDDDIDETDEDNNVASRVLRVGVAVMRGRIVVEASTQIACGGKAPAVNGRARYELFGDEDVFDFPVQGGRVSVELVDLGRSFGGSHTRVTGAFSQRLAAGLPLGAHRAIVEVTDTGFTGRTEAIVIVEEWACPPSGPGGTGGPGGFDSDLAVYNEDVASSPTDNPDLGEPITLTARIRYRGPDPVELVPIEFYAMTPAAASWPSSSSAARWSASPRRPNRARPWPAWSGSIATRARISCRRSSGRRSPSRGTTTPRPA